MLIVVLFSLYLTNALARGIGCNLETHHCRQLDTAEADMGVHQTIT